MKDRRYTFEIIVVDDGASESTKKVVDEAKNDFFNLRYVSGSHQGPARARNRGIEVASGSLIGFVDDDCLVMGSWVAQMVEAHQKFPKISCIGGETISGCSTPHLLISQKLSTWSIETKLAGKKEIIFFPTCNVSCKRDVFGLKSFDERFLFPGGEDLEFFWRLFKKGRRFLFIPEIKVLHDREGTVKSFLRQAFVYGRGNFLVQHMHRDHPLLKELRTGSLSFWFGSFVNILKIPRFSFLCGRKLIREEDVKGFFNKCDIYLFFTMHKICYIAGNIREFFQIKKNGFGTNDGGAGVPRLLILDITHQCNLMCNICDIWKTKSKDEDLGFDALARILSQAQALKIPEITLSGGEPLLRQDIFNVFETARNLKIKNLGVLSNGILVEKHFEVVMPYLCDNTISLVISFDSLKQVVHNTVRNSEIAWEATHAVLRRLAQAKNKNPQINFNVITVILNQNLEELDEIVSFVHSLGANSLQFQSLLPNNLKMDERKASGFWVPEERFSVLDAALDKLVALKRQCPNFIKNSLLNLLLIKKYYRGTLTSRDIQCQSAGRTVLVSTLGDCTTCFSSYGNIKKKNFENILNSPKRMRASARVKKCPWPCLLPCFCEA
jgi:MoaA/NifB/PqqE/SkfB family radical SAM enzyme/GT2 family glycosyltransferase